MEYYSAINDPAIPLVAINSKQLKASTRTDRYCTTMFIAAPFTIAKGWKQARCLLTDEWINKIQYRTRWNIIQP